MLPLTLKAAQTVGNNTASLLYNNLCSTQDVCVFAHQQSLVTSKNTVERPTVIPLKDAQPTDNISSVGSHILTETRSVFFGATNPRGFTLIAENGAPALFVPSDGQLFRCYAFVNTVGLVNQQAPCTVLIGTDNGDVASIILNPELAVVQTENHTAAHSGGHPVTCMTGGEIDDTMIAAVSGDAAGSVTIWRLNDMGILVKGTTHESKSDCVTSVQRLLGARMPGESTGGMVGASYSSGAIKLFNPLGELKVEIAAHSRPITGLSYNGFMNCLASTGEDQLLCVWKMPDDSDGQVKLLGHKHHANFLLTGCSFAPDGAMLHVSAFESDLLWSYSMV